MRYTCTLLEQFDQTDEKAFSDNRRGPDGEPLNKTVWEYAPITQLVYSRSIRYTVSIFVTTEGDVLSRSRCGGQFTKHGSGGGQYLKTPLTSRHSAAEGGMDEFGIGFCNPAILDVGAPWLSIEASNRCFNYNDDNCAVYVYVQPILLESHEDLSNRPASLVTLW